MLWRETKIITQKNPFTDFNWEKIKKHTDLEKVRVVIDVIEDDELINSLEKKNGGGQNFPVRAVWNSLLAGMVYQYSSIETLRKELKNNRELAKICGFELSGGDNALPGKWAYSRFIKQFIKEYNQIEKILDNVKNKLENLSGDNGMQATAVNRKDNNSTEIIAITSGKGGVGKTSAAVNIALSLSKMGKKVCIFDADLGLANINIVLGIEPVHTLQQVVSGEKNIHDVLLDGPGGIKIIPASSGVEKLANLNSDEQERLIESLNSIKNKFDILLIDTSAGISPNVLSFVIAAHKAVVVLTPEPTSLTDAYALIKVISMKGYDKPIWILVNMSPSEEIAKKVYKKMETVVKKFLKVELQFMGFVLLDKKLPQSVMRQQPICLSEPGSTAAKCFRYLAEEITHKKISGASKTDFNSFWRTALQIMKTPLFTRSHKSPSDNTQKVSIPKNLDGIKLFIQDKILAADAESEKKLVELYNYIEHAYSNKFNRPIQQQNNNSYDKIDHIVKKMETVLKNEKDITHDLTKIKEESGRYTQELWRLVNYINRKKQSAGEVVAVTDIGKAEDASTTGDSEAGRNEKSQKIPNDINTKNRFVEELNLEDIV